MKKLVLICLSTLLLSACADQENYQQAVLEQVKADQEAEIKADKNAKEYKIDPQQIAECIVDVSSREMPGLFPLDPVRTKAYRNYAKMLTLTKAKDPKKVMIELRSDFGSARALSDAHTNYAESTMECLTSILEVEKK
jgi:hypothetical protein